MTSKKELIYKGALKAFSQHEFSETTMDYIAEVSSVAKGTLYYYFKTKEELFLYVLEKGIDTLIQEVDQVIQSPLPRDEMLVKLLKVHLKFFAEKTELCQLLMSKFWGTHTMQGEVQKLIHRYFSKMEGFYTELQQEGYISATANIRTLASSLFGMVMFTALREIELGHEVYTKEIKASLIMLCNGVLKAEQIAPFPHHLYLEE